jgi:hypothetical protein
MRRPDLGPPRRRSGGPACTEHQGPVGQLVSRRAWTVHTAATRASNDRNVVRIDSWLCRSNPNRRSDRGCVALNLDVFARLTVGSASVLVE